MKKKIDTPVPDALTATAEVARKEFLEQYERYLQKVQNTISLKILVWGPSIKSRSRVAKKRIKIRTDLRKLGHFAFFSEEVPLIWNSKFLSEISKEYAQAQAADLIIVLMENAPGAIAEVHDFGGDIDIYHKLQIMIPKEYSAGYSANGAIKDIQDSTGGGCVFWYQKEDLIQCKVLGIAIQRAESLRNIKFRHYMNKKRDL